MPADPLAQAYAYCRRITNHHAKTFSFALRFLPRPKWNAVCTIYAFCRYADDIVDEAPAGSKREAVAAAIQRWRDDLIAVYEGRPVAHPIMLSWADMLRHYPVRKEHALELIDGVSSDLKRNRYPTFEALYEYCYKVASVVGLMTIEIFGYDQPDTAEFAIKHGIAMQLTNIIRDVGEDARKDRIYLPLDELARFDYSERELLDQRITPAFVELMRFQIARARDYYREAFAHIDRLGADSRMCVRLMGAIYSDILTAVERNGYDVFSRRAFVPYTRKLLKVPRLYLFPLVEPTHA